jgi:hypothetical protein
MLLGGASPRARIVAHAVKASENSVFGSCTLGRTLGHPSREEGFSPTATATRINHILGDVLT